MKRLIIVLIAIIGFIHLSAQQKNWNENAQPLHRAEKALTDVMVHDVFSPNLASRTYVYANIAAYEALAKQEPGYNSLLGQLPSFPDIPPPATAISSSLSSVYAFLLVAKKLVFSETALQDSI